MTRLADHFRPLADSLYPILQPLSSSGIEITTAHKAEKILFNDILIYFMQIDKSQAKEGQCHALGNALFT